MIHSVGSGYLPATVIGADLISVWKSGASADTSHWNIPDSERPTDNKVTLRAFETDTWNRNERNHNWKQNYNYFSYVKGMDLIKVNKY